MAHQQNLRPLLIALTVVILATVSFFVSCSEDDEGAPTYTVKVVAELDHAVDSYCQGFFVHDGFLWESAGQREHSRLRKTNLATGELIKEVKLDDSIFAEGAAYLDGKIYQLTWTSETCFIWDPKTMIRREKLKYKGEGWGLTTDGKQLIMSSGSNELVFRDPKTFEETKRVKVTDGNRIIAELNELEWIDGEVWANIYQTSKIAIINPEDGKIRAWIDCSNLKSKTTNPEAEVLNGIAYDATTKKVYLTGKLWNKTYQIEVEN